MSVLRVSATTNVKKIARAISKNVVNFKVAEIQVMGADAVNKAVKAIAIAREFFTLGGSDLICTPSFIKIKVEGNEQELVGILFTVSKVQ